MKFIKSPQFTKAMRRLTLASILLLSSVGQANQRLAANQNIAINELQKAFGQTGCDHLLETNSNPKYRKYAEVGSNESVIFLGDSNYGVFVSATRAKVEISKAEDSIGLEHPFPVGLRYATPAEIELSFFLKLSPQTVEKYFDHYARAKLIYSGMLAFEEQFPLWLKQSSGYWSADFNQLFIGEWQKKSRSQANVRASLWTALRYVDGQWVATVKITFESPDKIPPKVFQQMAQHSTTLLNEFTESAAGRSYFRLD